MYTITWEDGLRQELVYSSPSKAFAAFSQACDTLPDMTGKTLDELQIKLSAGGQVLLDSNKILTDEHQGSITV